MVLVKSWLSDGESTPPELVQTAVGSTICQSRMLPEKSALYSTVGAGVAVGGTGVAVGGTGVAVGGTGVAVAGTGAPASFVVWSTGAVTPATPAPSSSWMCSRYAASGAGSRAGSTAT